MKIYIYVPTIVSLLLFGAGAVIGGAGGYILAKRKLQSDGNQEDCQES